jgi:hypothetical protein
VQSLRRRVWATRFFENSVPDAFDAHFFNGLLKHTTHRSGAIATHSITIKKIAAGA